MVKSIRWINRIFDAIFRERVWGDTRPSSEDNDRLTDVQKQRIMVSTSSDPRRVQASI
jgi:hypothetical protein